jgi:outer membrane protein TolC
MRQSGKFGVLLLGGLLTVTGAVATARQAAPPGASPPQPPTSAEGLGRPTAINLLTALQLANVNAADIAAAAERIKVAVAGLQLARAQWLPTITVGGDYYRHDGRQQDTTGTVFDNSRSGLMLGAGTGIGPAAILNINDALFGPMVARQVVRAREADQVAAANDTMVAVTDAYFNVQQARGELAGAREAARRTEELLARTRKLVPALVADLEVSRAEAELARRQQAELSARARWAVASSELVRILRLDPTCQLEPAEPPQMRIDLLPTDKPVDELIALALTHRPELAAQRAQVEATLRLLKQERLRPLVPSVLLRGFSTPVTGTLAGGVFAGGGGGSISNAGARLDLDLQVLWQFDNLGFGNRARIHQREAEQKLALVTLFRTQDRVAAEAAQEHAQAVFAARRVAVAEKGVRAALDTADKSLVALGQTRPVAGVVQLLVRPQEVLVAVQALAQAYADYYAAVADANRAQFRLYRALGQPAQALLAEAPACPTSDALPAPAHGPPPSLPAPGVRILPEDSRP